MKRHPLLGWLLLAPSLLLLGGLVVFPIAYNVWLSLHDKHAFMPVQRFVGLKHYVYFAQDPEFWSTTCCWRHTWCAPRWPGSARTTSCGR